MNTRKYVIDKTTKKLLRYGFSDFVNDGSFLSDIEEIVIGYFHIFPSISIQNWYWNGTSFQQSPP